MVYEFIGEATLEVKGKVTAKSKAEAIKKIILEGKCKIEEENRESIKVVRIDEIH